MERGGGFKKALFFFVILILKSKEYQSVILVILQDANFAVQDYDVSLCFGSFIDPNFNVQPHSTGHVFAFNKVNFERQLL